MRKTNDKKIILKRIRRTLVLLTIANYFAILNLIIQLCNSGTINKILDYIFIIY